MNKIRVLANDGLPESEVSQLRSLDFEIYTQKVPAEQLISFLQVNRIQALLVRSSTKVTPAVIDACPELKFIARGGVGMDNIAVAYAQTKGVFVSNTPGASTNSVAELTLAHLLSMSKFLFAANRSMPKEGFENYNELKQRYADGFEIQGKTLGIIGFGRIGKAVAAKAILLGMKVLAYSPHLTMGNHQLDYDLNSQSIKLSYSCCSFEDVLKNSDVISLHVPFSPKPIIGEREFFLMKPNTILINVSRGGVVDEMALIKALNEGKISRAALDVFEKEPTPNPALLTHPKISLSPHLGASTPEAQARIGAELIQLLVEWRKSLS